MSDKTLSTITGLLFLLVLSIFMTAPSATVQAQGRLVWFSIPDITMTGSAIALSSTGQSAHQCTLTGLPTNAGLVRWGDALITTSRGSLIAPGGGQFLPPSGVGSASVVDLTTTYVIGTTGDKVAVTCAK